MRTRSSAWATSRPFTPTACRCCCSDSTGCAGLTARRTWHGLLVGAATALLALTSGYLAIFGIVCGLVVVAARWPELSSPPLRPLLTASLAGAVLIAVTVLPVLQAYREMRQAQGFSRSLDLVAAMSANGAAYVATPARVHERWARDVYQRADPKDSLFPGVIATTAVARRRGTLGG